MPSSSPSSVVVRSWARMMSPTGSPSSSSRLGCSMPSPSKKWAAVSAACFGVVTLWAAPLWRMAAWNSPFAAGVPSSVPTLMAPADSPKIVTFPGSPPKHSMWSRTHSSTAI
jgi:hypothetical protein